MTTRTPALLLAALATLAGCADAAGEAPPGSFFQIAVPLGLSDGDICAGVRVVRVDDGEVVDGTRWFGETVADIAEARAAGAMCEGDAGAGTPATFLAKCTGGAMHRVELRLAVFDASGAYDFGSTEVLPDALCVAGEDTPVEGEITVMRPASQGFFDVNIWFAPDGAEVEAVCYGIRVTNSAGAFVWGNASLCSTVYGDGQGSLSYVGPCDAGDAGHDENTVTVWMHPPGAGDLGFDTPCPAPADGAIGDWAGGCSETMVCRKNTDVTVDFDLTPAPAR